MKKTKFIVSKQCQKRTNQTIQILIINSQKIDQVKETVFLGVIMDENLYWKSEISHVTNRKRGRVQRISCKLRFLFKTLGLIRSSRILSYTNRESGLIPKQIHVQTA